MWCALSKQAPSEFWLALSRKKPFLHRVPCCPRQSPSGQRCGSALVPSSLAPDSDLLT